YCLSILPVFLAGYCAGRVDVCHGRDLLLQRHSLVHQWSDGDLHRENFSRSETAAHVDCSRDLPPQGPIMTAEVPIERLHAPIAAYYGEKVRRFGATPRGADWRDAAGQELRFARLLDIFEQARSGSLVEIGCGYGALFGYLLAGGWNV